MGARALLPKRVALPLLLLLLPALVWVLRLALMAESGGLLRAGDDDESELEAVPPIHVVFFSFLPRGAPSLQVLDLIKAQLGELVAWGLAPVAQSIDLVFSTESDSSFDVGAEAMLDSAESVAHEVLASVLHKLHVEKQAMNRFEYFGIRKAFDLARRVPKEAAARHLILYFHSKGAVFTHGEPGQVRSHWNRLLCETVVRPWKGIAARFAADSRVSKAGFAASARGFQFFNFWWARASYVQALPKPELTTNRYYYEAWLGRKPGVTGYATDAADCLSLCARVNPAWELGVWFDTHKQGTRPVTACLDANDVDKFG